MRSACAAVVGLALALTGGAAADEEDSLPPVQAEMEEADDQDTTRTSEDPWEGMNRKIFAFNEGVDRWFLEPVATGWDWALPETVQRSVGNFFDHMQRVNPRCDVVERPEGARGNRKPVCDLGVPLEGLEADAPCWRVLHGGDDGQAAVSDGDHDAEAAEAPLGGDAHLRRS